jgi:hypothetical protein
MAAPALQERIRSNTDCYLDLYYEPLRSPLGGGYLVRFLADSQGCIFWYLGAWTSMLAAFGWRPPGRRRRLGRARGIRQRGCSTDRS